MEVNCAGPGLEEVNISLKRFKIVLIAVSPYVSYDSCFNYVKDYLKNIHYKVETILTVIKGTLTILNIK